MKRIVALLIAIMVMCPIALADEITFRNIPWGSTPEEVSSAVSDIYPNGIDPSWIFQYEDVIAEDIPGLRSIDTLDPSDYQHLEYSRNSGYKQRVLFGTSDVPELSVAGHQVSSASFNFIFDVRNGVVDDSVNASRLVTATYQFEDAKNAYSDIIDKLKYLYGDPIQENYTENKAIFGGSEWTDYCVAWEGDNNTAIVAEGRFYTKSDTDNPGKLNLHYGKNDLAEVLKIIEEFWTTQERNNKYNASNTDGL